MQGDYFERGVVDVFVMSLVIVGGKGRGGGEEEGVGE